MKKIILMSISLVITGCSTLDVDDDFSDSVSQIESKQNYQVVTGKTLTPEIINIKGGQLVKSTLEFNYVVSNLKQGVPDSYITMELQYFKNYNQFHSVVFSQNGSTEKINTYAAATETCGDICTTTQYIKFPVDEALFLDMPDQDLHFDVAASKNSLFSFSVPAGYIKALVESGNNSVAGQKQSVNVAPEAKAVPASQQSKVFEMSQYWYEQLAKSEQDSAINWAITNRNQWLDEPLSASKEAEMFSYWYKKASVDERKEIIKQLLEL
ncbi:DUF2057 domain-containing protein [Vibrio salilacus]|uniref:DUF2057 domain-containing protein n=1 Tax=Vibrio salilacus TaxID=1323749 RepID=UPI000C2B12AF|nr:DUF2057 domain-containing protein [Vibrio salilacus]